MSIEDHSEGNPDQPAEASEQTRPSDHAVWRPALKEAGWAFLTASLLMVLAYTLFFSHIHPEFVPFMDRAAQKVVASGNELIPVSVGASRQNGKDIVIEDFNGDEAILALPRAFRAENYPFIEVKLSGLTAYSKAKILWQRAGDPTIHALQLRSNGDAVTQIAMVYAGEAYADQIDSIALLFYDGPALLFDNNNDVDIVVQIVEFIPFNWVSIFKLALRNFLTDSMWKPSSHNIYLGTQNRNFLLPGAAINAFFVLALLNWLALRSFVYYKNRSACEPAKPTSST